MLINTVTAADVQVPFSFLSLRGLRSLTYAKLMRRVSSGYLGPCDNDSGVHYMWKPAESVAKSSHYLFPFKGKERKGEGETKGTEGEQEGRRKEGEKNGS